MNMLQKILIMMATLLFVLCAAFFLRKLACDACKVRKRQMLLEHYQGARHSIPSRKEHKKISKNGIEERISFKSKRSISSDESIERKGILLRRPQSKATILICHGFMCDKNDIRFLRSIFHDYTTMTFDFRAHGEARENQCCTFGSEEMLDVIGAVHYIKSQPDLAKKPLIVYGFSMGAVASILAQSEMGNLFDAAIWDCPFDSTSMIIERSINRLNINIAGYEFAVPGRSFLKNHAYNPYVQGVLKTALKAIAKVDAREIATCMAPADTVNAMKKVNIPMLMITCKNDEKAPVNAVKAVYENAQGFKRLWITNGRCHFDSFFHNPEKYGHKVRSFITKFLDRSLNTLVKEKVWEDAQDSTSEHYPAAEHNSCSQVQRIKAECYENK